MTVILGVLVSLALWLFLPFATTNIFFLWAVPLIGIFFLLMVMSIKWMLIVLLFVRVLCDPLLNVTKLDILGADIGAGGAINLFIIIIALVFIIRNPRRLAQNHLYKSWLFFLLVCGLAITYSPAPGRAIKLFLNLVTYMCMAVLPFFMVKTMDDKKFWLKILFFSSFLPVSLANLDLLRGGTFFTGAGMRISGTFTHPNILAFYLVLILALSFYMLKSGLLRLTGIQRRALGIYMADLVILLLATKTRNAWVSCWGLFFLYGILKEKKYVFLTILLPFLLLLSPVVTDRIHDLFFGTSNLSGERLNSFAWRLKLWRSSLPFIKRRFILGHGLASSRNLSYDFFVKDVGTHNVYLELLFETGIVGLIGYLAVYLTVLKAFFSRIRKKARADLSMEYALVFSYIISYLIVCFADNLLYYLAFNWYFWFFIGVMLRGLELPDEKKNIGYSAVL